MNTSTEREFDSNKFFAKFCAIGTALLLSFLVIFSSYCWVKRSLSSGEITFCYTDVRHSDGKKLVILKGFRDWREDIIIGLFDTEFEASNHAAEIECKFGKK